MEKEISEAGKLYAKCGPCVDADINATRKRHFDTVREMQTGY